VDGVGGWVVVALVDDRVGSGWIESEVFGEQGVGEAYEGEWVVWKECG